MSKEEFLRILRIKISGAMPPEEVESQIDYYTAYIDGEIMKGKTEEEVIQNLGDPSLIAKTLTSAIKRASEESDYQENYNNENVYNDNEQAGQNKSKVVQMGGAGCIVALVIAVLVIILLIVLIIKFSFAIIGMLWPVILVLVIAGLIFGLIRRR